jgi:hypothetical protein
MGYNDVSGDVINVRICNINTNRWTAGTVKQVLRLLAEGLGGEKFPFKVK